MTLAADDNWMCEAHPGRVWPHGDCPGPGMPWIVQGQTAVRALLAEREAKQMALWTSTFYEVYDRFLFNMLTGPSAEAWRNIDVDDRQQIWKSLRAALVTGAAPHA